MLCAIIQTQICQKVCDEKAYSPMYREFCKYECCNKWYLLPKNDKGKESIVEIFEKSQIRSIVEIFEKSQIICRWFCTQ
ncbi:MAG: hypothetical protein MR591_05345 [Helicobacter sp.]|uniref:hypothetical protein n=1 Tax=Helicobacter sp. TaxID=218 RepID=UPI003751565A|nr:hypothetical protein [Helicobacter sp.]